MRGNKRIAAVALLMLAGAGAGAAAGWGLSARAGQTQSATAVVLLTPLEGNPFSPDSREGVLSLETEAQLVTADAVARTVAATVGGESDALQAVTSVEVPPNTQLLRVSSEDADGTRAREIADTFATEFLRYRETRTKAAVFDRSAHLREEIRAANSELGVLTKRQNGIEPGAPRRALLDQQVSAAAIQVSQLEAELSALGYVSKDPGQVVTPARVSAPGLLARPLVAPGIGAVAGLLLVVGVARLRHGRRVGSVLDLQTAGHEVIGRPGRWEEVRARLLLKHPEHPFVLLHADLAGSTGHAARASAEGLAESLARARLETVHLSLVHAGPAPDEAVAPGLEEVLLGKAVLDDVLHEETENLRSLAPTSPPDPEDWGDLVASAEFWELLADLRERAQVVVISGAVLPGALGEVVSGHVDRVLVRVEAGRTNVRDLEGAVRAAEAAEVAVVVLHDDLRSSGESPA